MNINYKSDFILTLNFEDGIPTLPWRMTIYSERCDGQPQQSSKRFVAAFDGECYTNAYVGDDSDSQVVIEMKRHGLPCGVLHYELQCTVENDQFQDGLQSVTTPDVSAVVLVEGASDDTIDPDIAAYVAPYIKGEKGDQGEKGEQGEKGDKGDKGDAGAQGDKGEQGEKGDDGVDGVDGADGQDGRDGVDGQDGKDGRDGVDGSTEALTLLNDVVEITNDGIKVSTGVDSNIMCGLIAVLRLSSQGVIDSQWVSRELGDELYFIASTTGNNTKLTHNLGLGQSDVFVLAQCMSENSFIYSTGVGYVSENSFAIGQTSGGSSTGTTKNTYVYIFKTNYYL